MTPRRPAAARALACLAALVALAAGCAASRPPERVVDLTHAFDSRTIYWPTEEGFVHERGFEGWTEGGYYYSAHRFRAAEHGGTHVDAPVHFHEGGRSVDEIPVRDLVAAGVSIDVTGACAADRDHRIDRADLDAWEARHGEIPRRSIVLLHTGFGARWPERESYMGTALRGEQGVAGLHFPGLHPEAARWLVEERDVRAVGIDTPSIDHGPSTGFEAHVVLAGAGVPAFENLAALDALPPRGFRVVALPMKIRGGSGAPLRIVALLPPE